MPKFFHFSLIQKILLIIIIFLVFFLLTYYFFLVTFQNRIFPGIKISGYDIGGMDKYTAQSTLANNINLRVKHPLKLIYKDRSFNIDLTEATPDADVSNSVELAYTVGRSPNILLDIKDQLRNLFHYKNIPLEIVFKNQKYLKNRLSYINTQIYTPAVNAKLEITNATATNSADIKIINSKPGIQLNYDDLFLKIKNYLALQEVSSLNISTKVSNPIFTTDDANTNKQILENFKEKTVILTYNNQTWTINYKTLINLLYDGQPNVQIIKQNGITFNKKELDKFINNLSTQIDQPVKEPRFNLNNTTSRVTVFQPSQQGRTLNKTTTIEQLGQDLIHNNTTPIELSVETINPTISTSQVNNLGIKQLIGRGMSYFTGSITNRIYNLELAASRINGVLIAPNKTFSFDNSVGPIDASTGYKEAYVISSGRTVLGDGGGVCQVSTTVFRAALNSGLPITDRTAHAYRVGYYEEGGYPPGLDATIYEPTVDLKFLNDTNNYILVQSYVKKDALYVDLYGTKDGRIVTMTKPKILSETPPPPPIYQNDPNLPLGQKIQVDWSAWGARVTFTRTVVKDGKTIIHDIWNSNYQPWAAVYLVGTKKG